MSWVAVAVAAVAAGTAVYSADKNRKATHQQQDAIKASKEADAREAAAAEANASVAANDATADAKRRRRANALALGDTSAQTLGGSSVLGAGAAPTTIATRPASTALSAGAL